MFLGLGSDKGRKFRGSGIRDSGITRMQSIEQILQVLGHYFMIVGTLPGPLSTTLGPGLYGPI